MIALSVVAAAVGLIVLGALWNGYVLTILWAWFVMPTFGLPELALAPAIGLAMVTGYLTHQYMPDVKKEGNTSDQVIHALTSTLMRPLMALAIGWIVRQWM